MRPHRTLLLVVMLGCGGQSADSQAVAPAAVSTTSASGDVDDGQRILLFRPHAVGDRNEGTLRARSQTVTRVTVDGEVVSSDVERLDITLVAEMVVQEVNGRGKPTRTEYTVRRCTTAGEPPRELLPPGAVFVVTAAEPPADGSITLVDGELSEDQRKRLDLVVSTHASTVTDDDIFGTAEPRGVGDSWAIDSSVAAQDLSRIATLSFTSDELSGATTFRGTEEVEGVSCQIVEAAMHGEGFEITGLPDGAVVQDASLDLELSADLPVDTTMPRLRSAKHMHMQMTVDIPTEDGRTAVTTVDNENVSTQEMQP